VTDALVVGSLGAVLGVGLGYWGLALLTRATPDALSRLRLGEVNVPVVLVSVGTVLAWMVLVAVVPAMLAARQTVAHAVGDDRRHTGGRVRQRLRGALTTAQIALSVVLVVGALLLVRTVQRVQQIDAGFDATGVMSFRMALPQTRYATPDAFHAFSRRLQDALAGMPGVNGSAAMSHAPYDHVPNWGGPYIATPGDDPSRAPQADYRTASPGAMELLGVRLLDGRWFTESDDARSGPVVIVDDRLARRTWPGESAVGRRLAVDPGVTGTPATWATVVGVVAHVRHRSPVEEVREQVYFSSRQALRNPSVYFVKTTADPTTLAAPIRDTVRALDPLLPIYDVRPLSAYVDAARALREFTATLVGLFAAAALLLAAIGVYGVVAYAVAERRREFGVRLALGATAGRVIRLVVGEGAWMIGAGVALGAVGAALGARWLRAQLVGVEPWDPVTLMATAAVLVVVSLAACAVPAIRAVRTDPSDVLRQG
jgi:predicted permease